MEHHIITHILWWRDSSSSEVNRPGYAIWMLIFLFPVSLECHAHHALHVWEKRPCGIGEDDLDQEQAVSMTEPLLSICTS